MFALRRHPPDSPPPRRDPPVDAYLRRLRRRAALIHGLRAAIAAIGASALVFALGALAIGPLGELALAGIAWALVAAAAVGVGAWAWRAFAPWRGAGAARLLAAVSPELPSAARSAYELSRTADPDCSSAMVRAHETRVRAVLARIPPERVVRWRWLKHRAVALGLAGVGLAGLLLATERGGAGAYALVHPGARNEGGERIAVAFSGVEAHLIFPSYLNREAITLVEPTLIEVPRGTSVELRARARLDAASAAIRVGERAVPMERDATGRFVGRFVAREDAPLVLRLRRRAGEWVHDAIARSVRALADEAPRVSLLEPAQDLLLDEPESVDLLWDASDDVGVAHVDLVLRDPAGTETRRRIASYGANAAPALADGSTPLDLALLNLQPGDALTVWLEARDGDIVSGPNIGRSRELHITLASEATRRERRLAQLEAVLDRALALLALRLEVPVPDEEEAAHRRFRALKPASESLIHALDDEGERLRDGEGRASDAALYHEMAARIRRLLYRERLAHGRALAAKVERDRIDGRAVAELEDDVLSLDDSPLPRARRGRGRHRARAGVAATRDPLAPRGAGPYRLAGGARTALGRDRPGAGADARAHAADRPDGHQRAAGVHEPG